VQDTSVDRFPPRREAERQSVEVDVEKGCEVRKEKTFEDPTGTSALRGGSRLGIWGSGARAALPLRDR
jgi:hypothetical protein